MPGARFPRTLLAVPQICGTLSRMMLDVSAPGNAFKNSCKTQLTPAEPRGSPQLVQADRALYACTERGGILRDLSKWVLPRATKEQVPPRKWPGPTLIPNITSVQSLLRYCVVKKIRKEEDNTSKQ